MPKLSHQWGFIYLYVFEHDPHAERLGLVEGPFTTEKAAKDAAFEISSPYTLMRRIPGGPWRSVAGRDAAEEWRFQWGPMPVPDGATVIPLRRIH